jgi:hypothetical protein
MDMCKKMVLLSFNGNISKYIENLDNITARKINTVVKIGKKITSGQLFDKTSIKDINPNLFLPPSESEPDYIEFIAERFDVGYSDSKGDWITNQDYDKEHKNCFYITHKVLISGDNGNNGYDDDGNDLEFTVIIHLFFDRKTGKYINYMMDD